MIIVRWINEIQMFASRYKSGRNSWNRPVISNTIFRIRRTSDKAYKYIFLRTGGIFTLRSSCRIIIQDNNMVNRVVYLIDSLTNVNSILKQFRMPVFQATLREYKR